jgi:lysozyme family protein
MTTYTKAFDAALDHAMLYEVGGFWDINDPAVPQGLIDTQQQRRAVGYVNDPNDRGGETKFGVAKNANPDLNISALTWVQTQAVYYIRYWLASKCDRMPPRVAVLHFDVCVNNGSGRAAIFLQRAVGVNPDGDLGEATLGKLAIMDSILVCNQISDLREQFYRNIVSNKPAQDKYLAGWLRRCNEMRVLTTNPENDFS